MKKKVIRSKKSKLNSFSRITYTGKVPDGMNKGINFLGYNFVTRSSSKNRLGIATSWVSKCRPDPEAIKTHLADTNHIMKKFTGLLQEVLISKLAPIIQGWTRYYSVRNTAKTFSYCSWRTFNFLKKWAKRRKRAGFGITRYWILVSSVQGAFVVSEEDKIIKLSRHDQTNIV